MSYDSWSRSCLTATYHYTHTLTAASSLTSFQKMATPDDDAFKSINMRWDNRIQLGNWINSAGYQGISAPQSHSQLSTIRLPHHCGILCAIKPCCWIPSDSQLRINRLIRTKHGQLSNYLTHNVRSMRTVDHRGDEARPMESDIYYIQDRTAVKWNIISN